ncbi:MAG: hypothetical protein EXR72_27165 [Myxococcales bacterium]|nr:hypothetical protein [Myxococcales bacterium]
MRNKVASLVLLMVLSGCASPGADPGPRPAATAVGVRHYVVDELSLPMRSSDFADDLDGDGRLDNQLGNILASLAASQNDGVASVPKMLADCALVPTVAVVEDSAGRALQLLWHGGGRDPATVLDGEVVGRRFLSVRTREMADPERGAIHLPILADSDPIRLPVTGLELELTLAANGLRGELHGATAAETVRTLAWPALQQMLATHPENHVDLLRALDGDHDGKVTLDEFHRAPLIETLLAPDLQLFDGGRWAPGERRDARDSISLGFAFHARPCPEEGCCLTP